MLIKSLIYAIIVFIFCLILQFLLCQWHLLKKKTIYAYLIDLKHKNPDLLVQTKTKLIKRNNIHQLRATHQGEEILIEINSVEDDFMKLEYAYWDKDNNKYYTESKSKKNIKCEITPIEEINLYRYKLKDREHIFEKESTNLFMNEEQVLFRNPFTSEYFWEKEINMDNVITEVELMKSIPKKLDVYFFNNKEMDKIMNFNDYNPFSHLGLYSVVGGICSLAVFFITLFM